MEIYIQKVVKYQLSVFQFDYQFLININKDYYNTRLNNKLEKMKIIQPKLSNIELLHIYNTQISKNIKHIHIQQHMIRSKRYNNLNDSL
jgi:hypothetical protein